MDIELRKYALEKAVSCISGDGVEIVKGAEAFYEFLNRKETKIVNTSPVVRPLMALDLPAARRKVLQEIIRLHTAGEKVSGVSVSKNVKISQASTSGHMRELIKSGHIKRQGNKFWPVLTPSGEPYVMPITKVPDGYAKGYRPMTQKLGSVASVGYVGK